MVNTGGQFAIGIDNNGGNSLGSGYVYGTALLSPTPFTTLIAGTVRTTVSSTGLAVTGALSATGQTVLASSSGDVGVGVTPISGVLSGYKTLNVGGTGGGIFSNGNDTYILSNTYYNGGFKYAASSTPATVINAQNGSVSMQSGVSSTAGAAITFVPFFLLEIDKSLALQGATSQTGTGITFPATQNASSNANTLDDYEEGTWTPVGNGVTLTVNSAMYTKIGREITCQWDVTWPTTANGGQAQIIGKPYASSSGYVGAGSISIPSTGTDRVGIDGGAPILMYAGGAVNANSGLSTLRVVGTITYFTA